MFDLNTTLDDSDPLIVYDPPEAWFQGDASTDVGSNYWEGTKTWTESYRATAAIRFNGTGVTVYGAKRFNHGTYSVRLDGTYYHFEGFASPDEYQAILFNASDLTQGIHDLLITNTGTDGMFLDIDYIRWVSSVGDQDTPNQPSTSTLVQDTDKAFTYGPPGTWNMNPQFVQQFNGSSGHSTSVPGAVMNYTFQGDAVSLYGTVGPQSSQYQVTLDDKNVGTFNGNRQMFKTQVLLYHADNLGPGEHVLSLINAGPSASLLEIDYASVFLETSNSRMQTTSTISTSILPTASDSPSTSSHTNTALTTGIIIITTVTVLFIMALVFLVFFLNRRNKALWRRLHKNYMVQNQFDSPPPPSRANATQGSSSRHPTETSESSWRTKGYLYDPMPEPPPPPAPPPREAPIRSDTVNTESTLVAENGSADESSPIGRPVTLKLVGAFGRIRDSPTIVPSRASSMQRPLLSEISEGSAEDDDTIDSPVEDCDLGSISPPPYRRLVVSPRGPRYR